MTYLQRRAASMSRGRAHTTSTDDESVECVGLHSLADDLLTHLVNFVPECRDVLSLAVVHALPEPAWRAAATTLPLSTAKDAAKRRRAWRQIFEHFE